MELVHERVNEELEHASVGFLKLMNHNLLEEISEIVVKKHVLPHSMN